MQSKEILIVETIRGEIQANKLSNNGICLLHEKLNPTVYPHSCERPLTLEYLEYHRNRLLSLENTALSPGMIDHELQNLLQKTGRALSDVVILDGSSYEARVPDLLEKYTVVKGYQYKITGNPSQNQKEVLLSKDHISKQLEYEFKLGNGKYKPGFIGELQVHECLSNNDYFNAYQAYLEFSVKNNCLIIINSLELGQAAVFQGLKLQNTSQSTARIYELFQKIKIVLQTSLEANAQRIVLYNIPFIFQTSVDEKLTQATINISHSQIMDLFGKFQCSFGFDLSRYSESKEALYYIAQLLTHFPNRIILSGGLNYKTDLTPYGGTGYLYYKGEKLGQMSHIAGEKNVKDALSTNKIRLLAWKIKKEEVKIVIMWKCSQCGGEQSETVQSFRKFGKQFCSIKCLKSHKF